MLALKPWQHPRPADGCKPALAAAALANRAYYAIMSSSVLYAVQQRQLWRPEAAVWRVLGKQHVHPDAPGDPPA